MSRDKRGVSSIPLTPQGIRDEIARLEKEKRECAAANHHRPRHDDTEEKLHVENAWLKTYAEVKLTLTSLEKYTTGEKPAPARAIELINNMKAIFTDKTDSEVVKPLHKGMLKTNIMKCINYCGSNRDYAPLKAALTSGFSDFLPSNLGAARGATPGHH